MTTMRFVAILFAAAFAVVQAGVAQAELKKEWVEYSHGDVKLKGYLIYDDAITGKRPAVLMIHARAGMSANALSQAEIWAKLGYLSFAADFFGYGQGILPKDVPEMQAQTAIYNKDRALMRARAQAGYDTLIKNPMVDASKVAIVGYCFGGTVVVEFAATGAPLVGHIAIHGSFHDHPVGWAQKVKGKMLILHGAEDVPYPLTQVDLVIKELRAAKVPFQLEVYSGTGHGYSTPKNKDEERANAQSLVSSARFLKEVFNAE
jgi:dienelactone hydrolase